MASGDNYNFCGRCQRRHAPPTGKRRCKLPLDNGTVGVALGNAFEALANIDIEYDGAVGATLPSGAAAPMANAGADSTNQTFQQILAVVTHLADKLLFHIMLMIIKINIVMILVTTLKMYTRMVFVMILTVRNVILFINYVLIIVVMM
jgi:hypothetical protein